MSLNVEVGRDVRMGSGKPVEARFSSATVHKSALPGNTREVMPLLAASLAPGGKGKSARMVVPFML